MYIKYYFQDNNDTFRSLFKTPNNWDPPVPANYNLVAYVSSVLYSLRYAFINDFQIPLTPNFNTSELEFLAQYKENKEYIIKPADKGCAIVIWSSKDYEPEALTQLDNGLYYENIALDPQTVLNILSKTITNFIWTCTKNKIIDLQTSKYLTPDVNPRTPIFYLLPKFINPTYLVVP